MMETGTQGKKKTIKFSDLSDLVKITRFDQFHAVGSQNGNTPLPRDCIAW